MSFNTILVHIDDSGRCKLRLDIAIRLAADFRAHLIGAYLVPTIEMSPFLATMLPGDFVEQRMRETGDAQHDAERRFRDATSAAKHAAIEWRAPAGPAIAAAIAQGRCADLIVVGQGAPGDPGLPFAEELATTTLLSTGRPVLVIPHIGAAPTFGQNALIAWDGGREASRAIADALPLLERAKKVNVIAVHASVDDSVYVGDTLASSRLAGWLNSHGVHTSIERLDVAQGSVGESLLSRAADLGSDLIVMGGYGHSRVREFVLGGVTRTMLDAMTVPVLMSH